MARRSDEDLKVAFSAVEDPALFHSLEELGTLKSVSSSGDTITVRVGVPVDGYPLTDEFGAMLLDCLDADDDREISLELEFLSESERAALSDRLLELTESAPDPAPGAHGAGERANPFQSSGSATRVLAIASGKGGVGKSSVTVNLAVALSRLGHRVGLLDADIYGFSAPRMLEVAYPPIVVAKTIVPPVAHGVRCISMGFFVDEDQGVAWRGPMLHKAIEQFLVDVHWGPLDFLLVDMPPGTGDVAMSVGQQLPKAELYVVTTPQPAAARVAVRAGSVGRQLRMPVRGVIENMSWFTSRDGERHELFGHGGGQLVAETLDVPLLGQIPLVPNAGVSGEDAVPSTISDPESEVAQSFSEIAMRIVATGPARVYRSELRIS
jgi:ATP-binding protein involved in chromosome partitioning